MKNFLKKCVILVKPTGNLLPACSLYVSGLSDVCWPTFHQQTDQQRRAVLHNYQNTNEGYFSQTPLKNVYQTVQRIYMQIQETTWLALLLHISMLYGSRCLNKNEEVRMSYKTVRWYLKHYELVKKMIESVLCHLENRR